MTFRLLIAAVLLTGFSGCMQSTPEERAAQEEFLETYGNRAGSR